MLVPDRIVHRGHFFGIEKSNGYGPDHHGTGRSVKVVSVSIREGLPRVRSGRFKTVAFERVRKETKARASPKKNDALLLMYN
jgi:hypothetical protein